MPEYQAAIAPIADRVVGTAAEVITREAQGDLTLARESAFGDFIADAQRTYAGADFAFMNPGGIQANIEADELPYAELFDVQPFDKGLVKMDLTGEQIYRLLEQQFRVDGGPPYCRSAALRLGDCGELAHDARSGSDAEGTLVGTLRKPQNGFSQWSPPGCGSDSCWSALAPRDLGWCPPSGS